MTGPPDGASADVMLDEPGPEVHGDEPAPPQPAFAHQPVLRHEVVGLLAPVPPGTVLDATVGGGGHAQAILAAHPHLDLLGLDQDPAALEAAARRLAPHGSRARLAGRRFDHLAAVLAEAGVERLSGFLFDLGVSSPQLDRPERGFSYRSSGPLDMRMDPTSPLTAADVVNTYPEADLAEVLRRYGDERHAHRIARAIVAARPLGTTGQLAEVVTAAIPAAARRHGGNPAKRSFQAIRIEVNAELEVLDTALAAALDRLAVGGRGLVITYHSGEDRIVKDHFRRRSTVSAPPGLPVLAGLPSFTVLRPAARRPSPAEVARNPRAASARLRAVERVAP
jgi:16S rRNA (cytosine1402-N4)-methyltransferase